jgi:arsenate reductase
MLRVYAYQGCATCRKALKFLAERKVAHEVVPIREQPPAVEELRRMLGHAGGDVRRLFNTSGGDYKAMNLKEKLPGLAVEEALALLARHGNLVKRPFALGGDRGAVGFRVPDWEALAG